VDDPWRSPFYNDDWSYYHNAGDEDFLAALTDEQKDAFKQT
jgi:hypothetical protein